MDGGSLDQYGAIPEPVLGKIAVGVSTNTFQIDYWNMLTDC